MCSVGGDSGRRIVGGRFHDRIPLSQIPVLCASLNVLSPSCTIENFWRAVRQPTRSIRGNRTKFNGVGQCVRSPDARRREAMKTATRLEQRGAIRFRPLRATMDWYGCTFEWIVGDSDTGSNGLLGHHPREGLK